MNITIESSIDDESGKEYVEANFFDCKSCGHKGFERSTGTKHDKTCLSKTVAFISKTKPNQAEKGKKDLEKYEIFFFFILIYMLFNFF